MAQRPLPAGQGPATLSPALELVRDKLPEGARMEERADGSVWLIQKAIKPEGKNLGPDFTEMRVDSRADRDSIARGEQPWYAKHLRAAKKEVKGE